MIGKILQEFQELCEKLCKRYDQEVDLEIPIIVMKEWYKDPRTGLEWGLILKKRTTWKKAKDWVEEQGGRLPTRVELIDLFENGPEEIKSGMKNKYLWTSLPHPNTKGLSEYVFFSKG